MMRFAARALNDRAVPLDRIRLSAERNMHCAIAQCGHCQLGDMFVCREGPVTRRGAAAPAAGGTGPMSVGSSPRKPSLAVWKFASCDGCQLTLLDCEDELLALAGEVELSYFLEAGAASPGGSLRPLARRGVDHDRGGRGPHPRGASRVEAARHDRRVRDRRRHPGVAQLRRRRGVRSRSCMRSRSSSRRWATRRRSPRTCPSTSSCAAARSRRPSCSR